MITKNESRFLQNCLDSVKALVNEIIIVDTGSTDNTKEIAFKYTSQIYDFNWCDDFSAARNESLKHAKGDWILVLDADEVIDQIYHSKIKELVSNSTFEGYSFLQRTFTNDTKLRGFIPIKDAQHFKGYFDNVLTRLFRNNKGFYFEGEVHEKVDCSIFQRKGNVLLSRLPIFHFSEVRSTNEKINKSKFYRGLLKLKLNHFQDARTYFEMGVSYKEIGDLGNSRFFFEKSLGKDSKFIDSLRELALIKQKVGLYNQSINDYCNVLKIDLTDSYSYFGLGMCYFHQNNFDKAATFFNKAIKYNPKFLNAYLNLAAMYEKMNQFEEAINLLKQAHGLNPLDPQIFHNLGVIHEKNNHLALALKCYEKAITLGFPQKDKLQNRINEIYSIITNIT
jgi:tetratricopeptide (TPR) repeat protein